MACLYDLMIQQQINVVNNWFYTTKKYDKSPYEYIKEVVYKFYDDCYAIGLDICVTEQQFIRAIGRMIRRMYHYRNDPKGYMKYGSFSMIPRPNNWNRALEKEWLDYLQHYYFDYNYWEHFWSKYQDTVLDIDIYEWKQTLTIVFPLFIRRFNQYDDSDESVGDIDDDEYVCHEKIINEPEDD